MASARSFTSGADGKRRAAGDGGIEGPVDGGDEGWVELGALRALHRGYGEWAVGVD